MDNKYCRFCGHMLKHTMVDLGLSPISNEYVSRENLDRGQYYYPLHVMVCDKCFLAQVMEYKAPEQIFTDYKYFSSFSTSWLEHCKRYVEMIVDKLSLNQESFVYEIACNDGYLLQYFQPYNIPVCGIEPAENVAMEARKKGIDVEVAFWSENTAAKMTEQRGKADLIIGNNVLAHVPDINSFVEGIHVALKSTGTVTMEFPHLLKLIQLNQFDTIYQEHFSYFSLLTVEKIFMKHGMKIYDVEELDTHGGSLRIYASHQNNTAYEITERFNKIIEDEKEYGLDKIDTYEDFAKSIKSIKMNSTKLLIQLKESGKKIVAFGAAAKGNTFLNYCGIGKEYIDYVADSSIQKQGMFLPGTRIPIVSPDIIKEDKPDYIVLLAWNLKNELSELLEYTREWGCKLITFIPETEVF